jgi:hypothetical protein
MSCSTPLPPGKVGDFTEVIKTKAFSWGPGAIRFLQAELVYVIALRTKSGLPEWFTGSCLVSEGSPVWWSVVVPFPHSP